jgi:hypothetical protein
VFQPQLLFCETEIADPEPPSLIEPEPTHRQDGEYIAAWRRRFSEQHRSHFRCVTLHPLELVLIATNLDPRDRVLVNDPIPHRIIESAL